MKITDNLTVDLNDEMFSECFYKTENNRYPRLSDIKFSNKSRNEIINEVANRVKRLFK